MTDTRRFLVRGRVQGVGFRYATKRAGERLELSGGVKNLPDGDVEVVAHGDPRKLAELEAWLRAGPDGARVTEITATPLAPDNWPDNWPDNFTDFRIWV